ncbi:MAG: efflux transporter outer membrane subunit [Chitinivibrionales bacterium]|nr:efflux transporter outer membrane subunit [Chitinivibrionales bacterium]
MNRLIVLLLLLPLAQACVGPRYHTRIDELTEFEEAYDAPLLGRPPPFWIEDGELDSLIAVAFERNPSVLSAWARVKQARAAVLAATAPLLPSVDASATALRFKTSGFSTFAGGGLGAPGGAPTTPFAGGAAGFDLESQTITQYDASLAASYELNLWSSLPRRAAAAQTATAARADARAMTISLAAEVANTWLMYVAQRQTVALLESQLETSSRFLEITEFRFGQGLTSAVDLSQQRQQTEAVRGRLVQALGLVKTLRHQLLVLVGYPPGADIGLTTTELPEPPRVGITGVPADLFSHRPDVLAAWHRLEAADKRAAAAVLDLLPSVRLSGSIFTSEEEFGSLFDELLWSLSGSITQPIFRGGRLIAAIYETRAIAQEQYYGYINTALTALREVRDALARIRSQEELIESLVAEIESAERALRLSRERYSRGALPYLQVLVALQTFQEAQVTLVEARRQLLSLFVQLYRAVGGNFSDIADWPEPR